MTYKWDDKAAEKYSKDLSALICNENYVDTDVLDGDQLLTITPVRQVNLLVVRYLYERWQEETRQLQSPYFDFDHPEVQFALDEFMNVLSQFIAVRQNDFEPLLAEVLNDVLQLCLLPAGFYEKTLRNLPNFRLTAKWLDNNRKYFVINRWVFDELKEALQKTPAMYANAAIDSAKQVLATKPHDNIDEIMGMFDSLLSIPDELKADKVIPVSRSADKPSKSFFDAIVEDRLSDRIRQAKIAVDAPPIVEGLPIVNQVPSQRPTLVVEPTFEDESVYTPPIVEQKVTVATPPSVPEVIRPQKVDVKRINENQVSSTQSLNDRATASIVADYSRLGKIESLRRSISLNQRFLFINNLFGSNFDEFNKAVEEFDNLHSYDEAKELMQRTYAPRFLWDEKSVEVEEFREILKRRFS